MINYKLWKKPETSYEDMVKSVKELLSNLDFAHRWGRITPTCECNHLYVSVYNDGVLHVEFYGEGGREYVFGGKPGNREIETAYGEIAVVQITNSLHQNLRQGLKNLDTLISGYLPEWE